MLIREQIAEETGIYPAETTVKVYLVWHPVEKRWLLDPVTVDGYPLDGPETGPYTDADLDSLTEQERAAFEEAQMADLPDAKALLRLLLDHYLADAPEEG